MVTCLWKLWNSDKLELLREAGGCSDKLEDFTGGKMSQAMLEQAVATWQRPEELGRVAPAAK